MHLFGLHKSPQLAGALRETEKAMHFELCTAQEKSPSVLSYSQDVFRICILIISLLLNLNMNTTYVHL